MMSRLELLLLGGHLVGSPMGAHLVFGTQLLQLQSIDSYLGRTFLNAALLRSHFLRELPRVGFHSLRVCNRSTLLLQRRLSLVLAV